MHRYLLLFLYATTAVFPAAANWTEHNFTGMLSDSRKLVPENLQWVLNRYAEDFETGSRQGTPASGNREQMVEVIARDVDAAVLAFSVNMSYREGARLMGRIARNVASLHGLLAESHQLNNQVWPTDYAIFLQQNRQYIRIHWRGLDHRPQTRTDLHNMLNTSAVGSDKLAGMLVEILNHENKSISEYDTRSTPFGLGTIAYSNAVNTIAYAWLYVWEQAGGFR